MEFDPGIVLEIFIAILFLSLVVLVLDLILASKKDLLVKVIRKSEGQKVNYLFMGRGVSSIYYYSWTLNLQVGGKIFNCDVSQSLYNSTKVGDAILVEHRKGLFTDNISLKK